MPRRPAVPAGTSVWDRPTGGRRQQAPAVTREQITDAATALADAEGLEAVTMRRLGARLGVAATSLYWYFSTKSELHELLADAVIGGIELPAAPSGHWRRDLEAIAWATLRQARRHPWFTLLFFQSTPGPATLAYGAASLSSFAADVDPLVALEYLAAVNNYVLGFAQRSALRSDPAAAVPTGGGDDPVAADVVAARSDLTGDDSFALGLGCLLDGIESRLHPRPGRR